MSRNPTFATEGTYTPDNLLEGSFPQVTDEVTIKQSASLVRGAVLGKCTKDTVGAATAGGSNTGNGTPGAVTLGAQAQVGTYTLRCTAAATNAGTFAVFAPDGSRLADLTVAVAYTGSHINLTIADGSADFVVGDTFTIAVSGTGKYKLAASAAVDGSQTPVAILLRDTDASAADKAAPVLVAGAVNERALTFGTGHDADSVRVALEAVNIYLRDSVAA